MKNKRVHKKKPAKKVKVKKTKRICPECDSIDLNYDS